MTARATVLVGDCVEQLKTLPDASVQMCCTSPPYWGLRDYGVEGQLGLEATPDAYVQKLVQVFAEVRRVLRDDGTLWLNLGDSYSGNANSGGSNGNDGGPAVRIAGLAPKRGIGLKPKDLVGIPWLAAFALRADGWFLRSEIIWAKPNPMPESVRDRPTKSHEYVFLLSKAATYYYDADAIAEPVTWVSDIGRRTSVNGQGNGELAHGVRFGGGIDGSRNARSVWGITTKGFPEAHFAVMPVELAQRCIRAGSKAGDCILDPFGGAGTTGLAAVGLGRNAVLIELNPAYAEMARRRIESPLFAQETA